MNEKTFMTVDDVAKEMSVSKRAVLRMISTMFSLEAASMSSGRGYELNSFKEDCMVTLLKTLA